MSARINHAWRALIKIAGFPLAAVVLACFGIVAGVAPAAQAQAGLPYSFSTTITLQSVSCDANVPADWTELTSVPDTGYIIRATETFSVDYSAGQVIGTPLLIFEYYGSDGEPAYSFGTDVPNGTAAFNFVGGAGDIRYCVSIQLADSTPSVQATIGLQGTINTEDSTTAITGTTSAPVAGQPITVDVAVSTDPPGYGTPTGTVTVSDGTQTCVATLDDGGTGSCQITETAPGSYTLTARYNGDGGWNPSVSPGVPVTVGGSTQGTSTQITGTTANPVVGQPITVAVAVTPDEAGGGTPTGTVTVSDGSQDCTVTLDATGAGACPIAEPAAGTYTFTASYAGDADYDSSSTSAGVTVGPAATTTQITGTTANPVSGQPITIAVAVSANAPGGGTPTGTVTVGAGPRTCTATLNGGTGSCQIAEPAAGTYTFTASYAGDASYSPSTSANDAVTVGKATPVVTLSLSQTALIYGIEGSESLTVTVAAPFSGTPTGTVTVTTQVPITPLPPARTLCTITLRAGSGSCTLSATRLSPNTYEVTASYHGDANFAAAASAQQTLTVSEATFTTISLSRPQLTYGSEAAERISVTVTPQFRSPVPGAVTVTASGTTICTIVLASGKGSCTLAARALAVGTYRVVAAYPGNAVFRSSASAATTLRIIR